MLPPLPIGYHLGSCTILHVLGQSACGITYLVRDPRNPEGVAVIKEFMPEGLALRDETTLQVLPTEASAAGVEKLRAAQEAFTAEMEALTGLRHRSVVEVGRVFRALGTTYAIMECIQGLTLAEWRTKNGQPTYDQADFLLRALLSALQCLHGQGLVHGDLREEHVRFRPDGMPVLLDFGVARQSLLAEGDVSVLTDFKSPAADLFALGAMMRRLIIGAESAATGRTSPLAKDAGLVATYGRGLTAGIDKAMHPNAAKGWSSAEDWLDSLSGRWFSRETRRRCKLAAGGAAALLVLGLGTAWIAGIISEKLAEPTVVVLTPEQLAEQAFKKAAWWLEEAPRDTPPQASADGSPAHPSRPDKARSLACMLEAAKYGHAEAPWRLVTYYSEGIGCEPNDAEVFRWCETAAKGGNAEAQYLLAQLYHESKGTPNKEQTANDAAAIPYLKTAAAAGLRDAQYMLARCYAAGRGLYADPEEAVRWYTAAGEQGDVRAQMELGRRYKVSDGVVMNHSESFRWYAMAADAGVAEARYCLALAHLEGSGTPVNVEEGAACLRRAAEQGFAEARYLLGHDIVEGKIPAPDMSEAEQNLKQAADSGMTAAQWELAEFYARGKGGEKKPDAAYPYYLKAAKAGDTPSVLALAEAWLSGNRNLPCDAPALRSLLQKAVEQGDATAMLYAGLMLDTSDPARATMLQKAADAGSADALAYLAQMQTDPARAEELYREAADRHSAFGEVMADFCKLRNGVSGAEAQTALSGLLRDAGQDSLYRCYTLAALAQVYLNGWGTDKDILTGLDYLNKAAEAGNIAAVCELAQAYEQGLEPLQQNIPQAMELYRRAAGNGSVEAMYRLALLCEKGGDDAQEAQAAGYFRRAAEAGHPAAMFCLARTITDKTEANALYRRAAEAGYAPAMPCLSVMYETGEGVDAADASQAFHWAHRAVEEGATGDAWDRLGVLYNAGIGVTRDEKEALQCWEKAAKAESPSGMYHYGLALYKATNGARDNAVNKRAGRKYLLRAADAKLPEAVSFVADNKLNEAVNTAPAQRATPSSRRSGNASRRRGSSRRRR